jgi:hypothetical protein
MDKALVKSFINWLEEASTEDIYQRQAQAKALLEQLTQEDIKTGVKYSLRLMDEELVARYCLGQQTSTSLAA